ncbi:TIGR03899 family protein [Paraglaciecola sp. 2405UD69-4]|uniref:TIGR03899 family protein n=1 Tax=Paraglaciecola sp. 2405UD69-4 TaxID=3391836 RepID=UPI0039C9AD56
MKIELHHSPKPIPLDATKSSQANPAVSPKPVLDKKVSKQHSQKKIASWFSQVGIHNGYKNLNAPSLDEKVRLKEQIIARQKVSNLESILGRALDLCLEDGKDESIDPDWFYSFVNMAEEIFSPTMQELWGRIFAVETAKPGSFSLKTLTVLKQLTQKDAQIFRQAVNLTSYKKGESAPRLLIGCYQKSNIWSFFNTFNNKQLNLAEYGLSYPDLLSLMDLGLIHHSEIESGELSTSNQVEWRCAGSKIRIAAKKRGTTLLYYKFTTTGSELCKLVSRQKRDAYTDAILTTLSRAFTIE